MSHGGSRSKALDLLPPASRRSEEGLFQRTLSPNLGLNHGGGAGGRSKEAGSHVLRGT